MLRQVTCFNATESDFQNFRTNWTNFRTLSEFQDISGHFLKFHEYQEFQDRAQACQCDRRTDRHQATAKTALTHSIVR